MGSSSGLAWQLDSLLRAVMPREPACLLPTPPTERPPTRIRCHIAHRAAAGFAATSACLGVASSA